jgi:hypothetical protein
MSYSSSTVMVQPHTNTLGINFSLSDGSLSSMKWSNAGWCYKMCTTCIRKVQRQCKQLQQTGLADMTLWHLLTPLIVKSSRTVLQCCQLTLGPWLHSARMLQKPNVCAIFTKQGKYTPTFSLTNETWLYQGPPFKQFRGQGNSLCCLYLVFLRNEGKLKAQNKHRVAQHNNHIHIWWENSWKGRHVEVNLHDSFYHMQLQNSHSWQEYMVALFMLVTEWELMIQYPNTVWT